MFCNLFLPCKAIPSKISVELSRDQHESKWSEGGLMARHSVQTCQLFEDSFLSFSRVFFLSLFFLAKERDRCENPLRLALVVFLLFKMPSRLVSACYRGIQYERKEDEVTKSISHLDLFYLLPQGYCVWKDESGSKKWQGQSLLK